MATTNLQNRTIFCHDNLEILQGINSNSIDLIYLDPPFNKNKKFTAPIGSSAEGANFKDIFRNEDLKDEWLQTIKEDNEKLFVFLEGAKLIEGEKLKSKSTSNFCYLAYMAIRLIEMHRILKDTGSVYLHCDNTMGHYIKILMDIVFGEKNFRNSIIWGYRTGGVSKNYFSRKHDLIYFYVKSNQYSHNPLKEIILYENPFFMDENIKANKEGKYPVEVYIRDIWDNEIKPVINVSKNRTGYPTQKPIKLLERIIQASSNEGDIVLDPFCGCATTCIASDKLNRKWVGIDVSVKAYDLVRERLQKEVADPEKLTEYQNKIHYFINPPKRTDLNGDGNIIKKNVYIISHPNYKKADLYKVGIANDLNS